MLFLITAAGNGERFKEKGIKVPKPLISVNNHTLLEHTLKSFSFEPSDKLLIAVQQNHRVRELLEKRLESKYNNLSIYWHELESPLNGQLATSYSALSYFVENISKNNNEQVMIHNCDTSFKWDSSLRKIQAGACMPVFEAEGDHWSFAKPCPNDPFKAIAIAEKQRISNLASVGLYGFSSIKMFLKTSHQQLNSQNTINNEFYIAPMLQQLLEDGNDICLPRVQGVKIYGTPDELINTFNISWDELMTMNK